MTDATTETLNADARTEILNTEVATWARKGWTVNSVSGAQAVLSRNKKLSFWWNLLFAVLTGGIWLVVVFYKLANRKMQSLVINVDARGKVTRRQ